jgi:hypothetical protein
MITVVAKRFCSGACKQKAYRDKEVTHTSMDLDIEPVTSKLRPKKPVTSKSRNEIPQLPERPKKERKDYMCKCGKYIAGLCNKESCREAYWKSQK